MYTPNTPFSTPLFLLKPTYSTSYGVETKTFPECGELFYGTFRTFGGTERETNGVYVVEDTATIETWYRPDIRSDCRVKTQDGTEYEIIGTPENIEMRNQYLVFKVRRYEGGV